MFNLEAAITEWRKRMLTAGIKSPVPLEELWEDLSRNEGDVEPPEWHGTVLAERERKLSSGEDTMLDWETAKQQLRAKLQ